MSGWLDTPIFNVLERSLDASSQRQKVLVNNVANVDTPNFKRSDVDFQQVLEEAIGVDKNKRLSLKVTSFKHLQSVDATDKSAVVTDGSSTFRNDGNNVDVEREMANIAENNIYYNAMTKSISTQLENLRTVITQK